MRYLLCQNEKHSFSFPSALKESVITTLSNITSNALRTVLKSGHFAGNDFSFTGEGKLQWGEDSIMKDILNSRLV